MKRERGMEKSSREKCEEMSCCEEIAVKRESYEESELLNVRAVKRERGTL